MGKTGFNGLRVQTFCIAIGIAILDNALNNQALNTIKEVSTMQMSQ